MTEASNGVAQTKKGEPLDVPLDLDAVGALELQEGEVLKLPPTPEMTDGHECEDDSETERIIHRSRPPLLPPRHTQTASVPPPLPPRSAARGADRKSLDLVDVNGTQSEPPTSKAGSFKGNDDAFETVPLETAKRATPPLPPRSKDRPASVEVVRVAESTTTDLPPDYNTTAPVAEMSALAVETSTLGVPPIPSPASSYGSNVASPFEAPVESLIENDLAAAQRTALPADSVVTSEIHTPSDSPVPAVAAATSLPANASEMSESERREWEQHLAQQKEEHQSPATHPADKKPLSGAATLEEDEDESLL